MIKRQDAVGGLNPLWRIRPRSVVHRNRRVFERGQREMFIRSFLIAVFFAVASCAANGLFT